MVAAGPAVEGVGVAAAGARVGGYRRVGWALLFVATTVNYIDRQVIIPLLVPSLAPANLGDAEAPAR